MVHQLTREDARRVAVRAQLLAQPRPTDALDVVRHLTLVQHDVTTIVAPSADLVLWSRLGSAYSPDDLQALLDERALVELRMMIRPADDVALYRAEMEAWPGVGALKDWEVGLQRWIEANNACREDVLTRLRSEGPLPVSELPDTCAVPWRSSGWTHGKNVGRLLNLMAQRGEVAVSSWEGSNPLWDLADRIYPEAPAVPLEEAMLERARRRLVAAGLERPRRRDGYGEQQGVGDVGEPAVVDGIRGRWRVDPDQLAALDEPFEGRAAVLSPLDRLVFDRKRTEELFEYEYLLEMYKPQAKRRWGAWAMPLLHGDRLIGKLDATADRRAGILRIDAVHEDEPWAADVRDAVQVEIRALADWLDLYPEWT